MTDYWIIFSEVTERGDNVGYFIIGTLCFISGLAMGVFLTALIVAGADDNIGEVTITRAYIEGTGGPVIQLRGQAVPRLDG